MKTMFDTNVLVAALCEKHPQHSLAFPWLRRSKSGEFPLFIAAHCLAECYATLTAKAPNLSIPPVAAAEIINVNFINPSVSIVELSASDYQSSIQSVASMGLWSGIIYDAILARAAQKADVERLVTFNIKHFLQVWPQGSSIITSP